MMITFYGTEVAFKLVQFECFSFDKYAVRQTAQLITDGCESNLKLQVGSSLTLCSDYFCFDSFQVKTSELSPSPRLDPTQATESCCKRLLLCLPCFGLF